MLGIKAEGLQPHGLQGTKQAETRGSPSQACLAQANYLLFHFATSL